MPLSYEQKLWAIADIIERYHQFADGESLSVKGAAGEVLVMRIEATLGGVDWKEEEGIEREPA